MTPYLIFSDIDGTLVDDQQRASKKTVTTIKRLLDTGHTFYLATGRMYASAQLLAAQLDPRVKIIASNGSIYDSTNQIVQHTLGAQALAALAPIIFEQQLAAFFFTKRQVIYTQTLPDYFKASDRNRIASANPDDYMAVTNASELLQYAPKIINGIIIEDQDPVKLLTAKRAITALPSLTVSSSNPNNIELIPKHVSKATAIQHIQQQAHVPNSHTIAFGDGLNDLPMLKTVAKGVAMGNALPTVKQQTPYQTTDNLHDGVADFLQNFFSEAF